MFSLIATRVSILYYVISDVIANMRDPKQSIYMDSPTFCDRDFYDNRLTEGDTYSVTSDSPVREGPSYWTNRAKVQYCPLSFDFGDRLVAVVVNMWRCDTSLEDNNAYLAVYADCDRGDTRLLKWMNCSVARQIHSLDIYSPGSCVSLFFSRGIFSSGSQFELIILARYELYPAYKIAAVLISSIVLVMLVVKVFCVVTGYERRLPVIHLDVDEHKHILSDSPATEPIIHVEGAANVIDDALLVDDLLTSPSRQNHASCSDPNHHVLSVTRSTGSCRSSRGSTSDVDFDLLDLSSTSRLKRYPSTRVSSIWRHK